MNGVVRKNMYREQCIYLEPNNTRNVIDLRDLYNKLGEKADKLISLNDRIGCELAVNEAFRIYKLMNKINRMFKYRTNKNIWE